MEQKTKWYQPWTGICPVCNKDDCSVKEINSGVKSWVCDECLAMGTIAVGNLANETIYLDNPEDVYPDYPQENLYDFQTQEGEAFQIRESHLEQHHMDMLMDYLKSEFDRMPKEVQRRFRMLIR